MRQNSTLDAAKGDMTNKSDVIKTRVRDPKPRTVLTAPAGGRAEAEFTFFNDSPDVAGFCLDVAGLAADWVGGSGPDCEAMAAASGGGTLALTLAPPAHAAGGDYEVRIRILSGGVPLGGETPLILRVEPAAAQKALPASEAVSAASILIPSILIPSTPVNGSNGGEAGGEAVKKAGEGDQAPHEPVTDQTPHRPPMPEPEEKTQVLVDMDLPAEEVPEEVEAAREPSALDPPDGASLALSPGDTLLVRFGFSNDGPRERTYILDEDGSLTPGWLTLVKDQVNLTRNGRGEVSLRLTPPPDARPGDYPFAVTVGPQGDILTSRLLTLAVAATPAVKITAAQPQINIGPLGTYADFPLAVESVGNADTAFRIAVKAPPVKRGEEAKSVRGSDTVYETPQWRYLFDREAETLRSAGGGHPPRPVNLRFRLQRRGAWWLGFQESHQVTITAVPVTDPGNGGKTENVLELTAVRRRPLPFPGVFALLLLIPLLLLLVVKASYLGVSNAYVSDSVYYVLGTPGGGQAMTARLRWEAPFFAFVNVSATQNGETDVRWFRHGRDEDKVTDTAYGLEKTYEVTRRKITVRFVPIKTDHKLQITQGDLEYAHRRDHKLVPTKQGTEPVGEDSILVGGSTYLLPVPRDRNVPLNLLNTTPRSSSANIQYWIVHRPDPSFFTITDSKDNDQIGPTTAAAPIKLRATGGATSGDQELTLVTTDGGSQIVHIKLKAR